METKDSKISILSTPITNIKSASLGILVPSQISATLCVNDAPVITQTYILIDEYDKLKEAKRKLEIQVETLQNQINATAQLRQELEKKIVELTEQICNLNKQIGKLQEENASLQQFKNEFDTMKMYQKFSDSFRPIFSQMHDAFCRQETDVYKKSGDTNLYHLYDHLIELHTQKYIRKSKVKVNLQLWKDITQEVIKILHDDFEIDDIQVFFEIIRITGDRNSYSHSNKEITREEIALISSYSKQLWECLQNSQTN